MSNEEDIVFVDPMMEHFFWIVEIEDHVHDSRTDRCVKNLYGPRCGGKDHKTLLDKALDWVTKRL